MATTNKPFDCVEMKHAAQRQLRQDYAKRKGEFSSYIDFVNAVMNENPDICAFHKHITKPKAG